MKWLLVALIVVNSIFTNANLEALALSIDDITIVDFVDTETCYSAIEESVVGGDGDKRMGPESYVDFVKAYAPDNLLDEIDTFEELPLLLVNNFYLLACLCKIEDEDECCVGSKAAIETNGAFAGDTPTDDEKSYLFLVCSQTSTAIDRVIQSMSPSESPVADITTEIEVVVNYTIGVEDNDSTFEDYGEELISAMNSLAPTLLAEEQSRQLRSGRNLESVFLPTSILYQTAIGTFSCIFCLMSF